MVWEPSWESPFAGYLSSFNELIGDRRTGFTFRETIKGIIASGSLICQRIAGHSQLAAGTTKGSQRVIRLVKMEPWLLLTDWPVTDADSALCIFRMYRQRWSVEDAFKFTKECLGWEDVQLLDLSGIRTLVALSWVTAGFLYELGVTLDWPEVQLVAQLGSWEPHKGRKPGKITLTRGLHRIMDMLTTEAFLTAYIQEHGALPPRIAALLRDWSPPKL